jgi:hypothetical protein
MEVAMPITQIVPHEGGGAWGWDTEAGKWVGVDPAMAQGSVPGNLARAFGRGAQDIGLGIEQLAQPNDPQIQARIKVLNLQKEAASRAAPWTEAIGEGLPDVAAGLALTPFTGGMSVPAMLAGGAAGGALSGFVRPGTIEERVQNALIGGALGATGVGLNEAAVKGVTAALKVGETIATRNAASVARGVEVGGQRIQNAADRAAFEASQAEGGAGGADFTVDSQGNAVPGGGGAAADQGAGSAGAARNPNAPPDPYAEMEAAGASGEAASNAGLAQRQRVEDIGYRSPSHADTRSGSIPRWLSGVNDTTPWGQMNVAADKAANQELAAKTVGEAMTVPDAKVLDSHTIGQAGENLKTVFENAGQQMPRGQAQEYADLFKTLQQKFNVFDKGQAQKEIDGAIRNLEAHGGEIGGETIMRARSTMADLMAGFYDKPGTVSQGDLMRQALEKLDDFISKKAAEQGDRTFAQRWAQAREQWQVYGMVKKVGATSNAGDVNPRTLINAMKRDPRSGGFGHLGPRNNGPARRAFDLLDVMNRDENGIPMTGVRTAGALANLGLNTAGAGLVGGSTMGILNQLMGR